MNIIKLLFFAITVFSSAALLAEDKQSNDSAVEKINQLPPTDAGKNEDDCE